MPVFKAVIKSLKEYRSMFIVYFMIFAVFGPMQANAQIGKNEKMFSESSLRVTVIDQDDSELSRGLIDYLETNEEVEVLRTVSDRELQNLNDDVNFEQKDYVLLIDQDFEDKLLKGDTKDSIQYIKNGQSASGYLMTEKIDTYLNYLMVYLKSGYDESSAIRNTAEDMKEADESQVSILENPNMEDRMSVLFRFDAYSMMMMLIVFSGSLLTALKKKDIAARIRVGGTSFRRRYGELILALLTMAVGVTVLLIGFTVLDSLVHGVTDFTKLPYYVINAFAAMFVGIGIGYFVSTIAKEDTVVNMIANMINLSMCFLCGVFVGLEYLSDAVIRVAHFMPLYWYIMGNQWIVSTTASEIMSTTFATQLGLQLLFAAAFFMAGLIISKKKEVYNV